MRLEILTNELHPATNLKFQMSYLEKYPIKKK